MLTAIERRRLTVVLVGARNPSNIGAVARAMQDFGFTDLRVVNDYAAPFEAAQLEAAQSLDITAVKSAVGAASVMARARLFSNLAEALADCTLAAGTTAIGERDVQRTVLTIQDCAPQMLASLRQMQSAPDEPDSSSASIEPSANTGPRVALLFGSEKTGLTNEQLSHCSLLTTIPMFAPEAARHLSMNLGQAVAVCLYELTREGFEGAKELPLVHEAAATADDRERLTQLLLDAMYVTGYTRRFPANAAEPLVRQLTQQLGQSHREAMTWMGILRQILWSHRKR